MVPSSCGCMKASRSVLCSRVYRHQLERPRRHRDDLYRPGQDVHRHCARLGHGKEIQYSPSP
eukprot:29248-Eustigmatos_ZCMA.PRE.1